MFLHPRGLTARPGEGMEDFIVRIYRRKDENGGLFGVVEEVGVEGRKPFRSMGELVALLRGHAIAERREEAGIRLAIPVTVEGRDLSGASFAEDTFIEELSGQRAEFRLESRVPEGEKLLLRILPTGFDVRRKATVTGVAKGPAPRFVEVVFG